MSLAVIGADYPDARGPTRRFEMVLCAPGELIELRREPKHPADSRAIGVYSVRGFQLGYIRAEQAQWIGAMLGSAKAVFQAAEAFGAVIRVTFDESDPVLPVARQKPSRASDWPPPEPRDDFAGI